jgi:hypothetical protein
VKRQQSILARVVEMRREEEGRTFGATRFFREMPIRLTIEAVVAEVPDWVRLDVFVSPFPVDLPEGAAMVFACAIHDNCREHPEIGVACYRQREADAKLKRKTEALINRAIETAGGIGVLLPEREDFFFAPCDCGGPGTLERTPGPRPCVRCGLTRAGVPCNVSDGGMVTLRPTLVRVQSSVDHSEIHTEDCVEP